MRIALVDVNYNLSSTGKIVADLLTGFEAMNYCVSAYYGRGPTSKVDNVYKISSGAEVSLHAFGTRVSGFTDYFSPVSTYRLIKHLEYFKPDVVHLHDLHGYFININSLVKYLKKKNIPTVWTFHCEFMYTGKCGYALDCEKWKSHCDKCPSLHDYPKSWFFDFTAQMFEQKRRMFDGFHNLHLTAPSRWLANRMHESVIVGDKLISIVPNGLDTDIFHHRESDLLRSKLGLCDEYIVLSVGSNLLSEIKGGRWVLDLARRNPSIAFVMVGVDSSPSSVPANVKLIPSTSNQCLLAEYYSMADVLLLTSSKETFSMVCAESLACGTPVIGFDSGAPREVAPPGFGEFVPYADLDGLEFLLRSVKNGNLIMKSAKDCEDFAVKCYSKEIMINTFDQIYRQLVL